MMNLLNYLQLWRTVNKKKKRAAEGYTTPRGGGCLLSLLPN
jgi:hypothetical protein